MHPVAPLLPPPRWRVSTQPSLSLTSSPLLLPLPSGTGADGAPAFFPKVPAPLGDPGAPGLSPMKRKVSTYWQTPSVSSHCFCKIFMVESRRDRGDSYPSRSPLPAGLQGPEHKRGKFGRRWKAFLPEGPNPRDCGVRRVREQGDAWIRSPRGFQNDL